ncbi:MAG TPA: hypothetical protein VMU32_01700 [Solirubrobacteraceae bacterium]|nr:hypothetical protein [Solirubrobacteraceae bacterium]
MSSPIAPTPTPAGTDAVRGADAPPRIAPTPSARTEVTSTQTVSLDALPSSPPPEVLDEMAKAAAVYDELSTQGRELRFARDAASGRTQIEVRDRSGNLLGQLSPAQALDLAAGAPMGAALE